MDTPYFIREQEGLESTRVSCRDHRMYVPALGQCLLALAILAIVSTGISVFSERAPKLAMPQAERKEPDYNVWEAILQKHVKPSEIRGIPVHSVDYDGFRGDPSFAQFVKSLETAPASGLGKAAEYALWINSYNALAIKLIVEHPCKRRLLHKRKIESIKELGTLFKSVWNRPIGVVGGQTLSLGEIEHGKLRAPEGYPIDPLLHACIVCASVSCPDVAITAYKPESLDEDMAANMRRFLANEKKGLKLDKDAGTITLSKVFDWFAGDFTKGDHESVLDALLPYMPKDVQAFVAKEKTSLRITYFGYDWGLNGPSPGAPGKNGSC